MKRLSKIAKSGENKKIQILLSVHALQLGRMVGVRVYVGETLCQIFLNLIGAVVILVLCNNMKVIMSIRLMENIKRNLAWWGDIMYHPDMKK